MPESKKIPPQPVLKGLRHSARLLLFGIALGMGVMLIAFLVASIGVSHPDVFLALRYWMQKTSLGWLAWRLMLYIALGWGFWKIWHAPGCRSEYKAPLKRMAFVSVMFLLACEYAVYIDAGMTP